MDNKQHRIIYALYSKTWKYGEGDKIGLENSSAMVTPEEFTAEIQGKIYCPLCTTPLSRTPALKNISSNNITAHFKHGSSKRYEKSKECDWRVNAPAGMNYKNEEETNKAVENQELIIVSGWKSEPPSLNNDLEENGEFTKTAIEDENGPETLVPIGRYTGREYKLPSNVSTVMAVCKDFPKNLKRGFYFPNSQYAMLLSDQLYSTLKISDALPKKETLFFGKITSFNRLTHRNVITIKSGKYSFKIYTSPDFDKRKVIDNTALGRNLLFSASLYWESQESIVACKVLKWGAYSLLPAKHDKYLSTLA